MPSTTATTKLTYEVARSQDAIADDEYRVEAIDHRAAYVQVHFALDGLIHAAVSSFAVKAIANGAGTRRITLKL